MQRFALLSAMLACCSCSGPVPSATCTPDKNQRLLNLLSSGQTAPVDNVMACGTTISPSRPQRGGLHGSHQIIPLRVMFSDGSSQLIEVVTNDELDGILSAPQGVEVSAYGQAFFDHAGHFAAGIHDVHCSTHRGADDGWVIVNGEKFPKHC